MRACPAAPCPGFHFIVILVLAAPPAFPPPTRNIKAQTNKRAAARPPAVCSFCRASCMACREASSSRYPLHRRSSRDTCGGAAGGGASDRGRMSVGGDAGWRRGLQATHATGLRAAASSAASWRAAVGAWQGRGGGGPPPPPPQAAPPGCSACRSRPGRPAAAPRGPAAAPAPRARPAGSPPARSPAPPAGASGPRQSSGTGEVQVYVWGGEGGG
jgi:hypothetical protein